MLSFAKVATGARHRGVLGSWGSMGGGSPVMVGVWRVVVAVSEYIGVWRR
jgi:hypothetical protein